MSLALVVLVLACGGPSPELEQDLARLDKVLTLTSGELPAVRKQLSEIQDPVVRDAAVTGWLEAHIDEVPQGGAIALCAQLDGSSRQSCERQVSSPHLRARPPQ